MIFKPMIDVAVAAACAAAWQAAYASQIQGSQKATLNALDCIEAGLADLAVSLSAMVIARLWNTSDKGAKCQVTSFSFTHHAGRILGFFAISALWQPVVSGSGYLGKCISSEKVFSACLSSFAIFSFNLVSMYGLQRMTSLVTPKPFSSAMGALGFYVSELAALPGSASGYRSVVYAALFVGVFNCVAEALALVVNKNRSSESKACSVLPLFNSQVANNRVMEGGQASLLHSQSL